MERGLVDIHCHGAVGASFGSNAGDSRRAVAHHAAAGVSGVVASLVSGPPGRMAAEALALAPLVADATVLGLHLEGPFLAPSCRGAHDPRALSDPDPALIDRIVSLLAEAGAADAVRQATFAPELPGAYSLIRTLAEHGIVPALGHTAASPDRMRRAIETVHAVCGAAPVITHLFNGMPPFHHRAGGPAAVALAAAARGEAFVEVVADGVHLAPEVVRLVFETVGAERVVLVSDATAAVGLGDGPSRLGPLDVLVVAGVARVRREDGLPGALAAAAAPWPGAFGGRWRSRGSLRKRRSRPRRIPRCGRSAWAEPRDGCLAPQSGRGRGLDPGAARQSRGRLTPPGRR